MSVTEHLQAPAGTTPGEVTLPGAFAAVAERATSDPEGFWLDAAQAIDWDVYPTSALDDSAAPLYRWFPDARLNTSYNALDRHVLAGRGETTALIYDSPVVAKSKRYSYSQLLQKVELCAGMLAEAGVVAGDRVVIYLPMIPQAVVAMLACARLGAVHSVVFGGFAAKELAARLDDAGAKVIITASGGIEPSRVVEYLPTIVEALALSSHTVTTVVVKDRPEVAGSAAEYSSPGTEWLDWHERMLAAEPHAPVSVAATDPLYILYTSGTTGSPKGVVRDNGGHAVAMTWSMKNIYGVHAGEVMWTASDVGWVVGHSYIVYGPLLAGATTVLYEGKPVGTPDAGAFWRVVSDYRVKTLFTSPTALRSIRKADPHAHLAKKYDLTCLDALFLAGERLDPDTWTWATALLEKPVIDHWWQTETGWAIAASPYGIERLPLRAGSPSFPSPGYNVEIVDDAGRRMNAMQEGHIVIRLPLPPGTLSTLWRGDQRYIDGYLSAFPGFYLTGDSGFFDRDGYLFVMGRTDDIINVAGHRLSTGSMEQVLAQHPSVAECAVIGLHDAIKGQKPAGYVVLKSGADIEERVLALELVAMVRNQIGAVAAFKEVTVVASLPKTRSGKILRKTMRQIINGEEYVVPPTIDNVEAIAVIVATLATN
ncbi:MULTISPECIES: AMP-binding protein [Subtercola]|uniref:Propionyl-CoA synthetase n=1 Tax=Subtercola vilae TaxID=2056433 RepID=A0A4T2C8S9_9MICO|nr:MULTISPECIES: AMP-binding protein [Subtercola]MEA9983803.1 AMP-binding protein [Subtercola sp. RTI3]TIH40657.1 propionyl-CoA synthetase [Subtercola vilae]